MTCTIHWNSLSLSDWNARFKRIRRSNLLQSYEYGLAMREYRVQIPRWGLIEINGSEAGLLEILEVSLFGKLMHGVMIDRGPLWFEGFGKPEHIAAFLKTLRSEFRSRIGLRMRFLPELEDTAQNKSLLTENGFRPLKSKSYQTLWLDLTKDSDTLRTGLQKKWRNSLSKAERSNITIEWDEKGEHLPWFLTEYHFDKQERGYPGPPAALLKTLAKHFSASGQVRIGRASVAGEHAGGILIFIHGACATYQAGFTNETGRGVNAHNLLLWQACSMLQEQNITDFDLGGINEDEDGIRKFKEGMGGECITLPGLYH